MSDYLIKQSHECIWHFTHMQSNGLCFSKMNSAHKQEYEVLFKEAKNDYDILIDDNNYIHLVCQDETGSIIYLNYFDDKWHKHVILKSKTPTDYQKNFRLLQINDWINLFYTIEYRGKKMLSHQILDNSGVTPTVLDYIVGNYTVTQDLFNNLWVFYHSEISDSFGYRKYAWSRKEWEAFVPIETAEGLNVHDCVIDKDEKVHMVGDCNGEILYINLEERQQLGKGSSPILFMEENQLWSMWVSNSMVQARSSNDNGTSWRSSGDFVAGRGSHPILFHLAYTSYEKDLQAKSCYGYYNNDQLRLYVLNKFFQISQFAPQIKEQIPGEQVQEFAEMFQQAPQAVENHNDIETTKLKIQISALSEQIAKAEFKIDSLKEQLSRMDSLSEQLSKMELMINELGKEIHVLTNRQTEKSAQDKKGLWSIW